MEYKDLKHVKLGNMNFYNGNNMELLKQTPDKYYDIAIVDPPYGISINPNMGLKSGQTKRHESISWDDEIPSEEYFNELFRVSKNQIIWGGNYFPLPPCKHFIFWDKLVPEGMSFSAGEMAWTSFNKAIKKFTKRNTDGNKIHPTEKPIELYEWILNNYVKPTDKILDTHLGSGSIALACHKYGYNLTAIELDEKYFEKATSRIESATKFKTNNDLF